MPIKYKIITIDGPAGAGKSTIAQGLARELDFAYVDTGALYRAVTWKVLQEKVSLEDQNELNRLLQSFSVQIEKEHYFVGDIDVTVALREQDVTNWVSEVSAKKAVRDALLSTQIDITKKEDTVFEGRDLGSVVFPNADVKFFLTASAEIRAKRRWKELQTILPQSNLSLEEVLKNIKKRDQCDLHRTVAPLKRAPDAMLIDTSNLSIQEVIENMKIKINKKIKR